MIWLYGWLASIIPAILLAGFVMGRIGAPRTIAYNLAMLGVAWPLLLPILGLVWLIERSVLLGEQARKAKAEPQ